MNDSHRIKRFTVITLGCKVNQVESAALIQALTAAGWSAADDAAGADLVVVNTCSVTAKAGRQSRQAVRRAAREALPGAVIVATGCHVQTDPEGFRAIPGLDYLVGHPGKDRLAQWVGDALKSAAPEGCDLDPTTLPRLTLQPTGRFAGRTRGFLKVQDGCNAGCAYCTVPLARGKSRSLPLDQALAGATDLLGAGHRELVLTGIHLGAWGRDLDPAAALPDLVRALLGLPAAEAWRLRLSSIEVGEVGAGLVELLSRGRGLCPHLHLPIQTGDDDLLAAMGRPYTAADVVRVFDDLSRRIPDIGLGADVLVGLPGESEAAFKATMSLIEALPVDYLHVFPYSPRPGTRAVLMPGQVPAPVARDRAAKLRQLDRRKRAAWVGRSKGQIRLVLVESRRADGRLTGRADSYLPVVLEGPGDLIGRIIPVRIIGAGANIARGVRA